ncbi:MAG: TIGR02186 family protein [Nitrospirae bacterium]|nr:TIGR02186 family protein [Nitrospirota bacterium]
MKDKMVVEKAEAKVLVEQVGVIKTLSNMAKNSGALYGFLSIAIALGAGFGVGLIFRKGGGSH